MRKINPDLKERLLHGDLKSLFDYIKSDEQLKLEVRTKGEAFVYYRKGLALEIGKLVVDKKYGKVPPTDLAIQEPEKYFQQIKLVIDDWLKSKKNRNEFDTQQKIAYYNQDINERYFIVDMEYAFEQHQIEKSERLKRATFDLFGIDMVEGRMILFELKKGMKSLSGKSGIQDHINDFNKYIHGKNSSIFRGSLYRDLINIITDKRDLGLIPDIKLPANISTNEPEMMIIFHPTNEIEELMFKGKYENIPNILIVTDSDFKLKKP
ncbi:hypothetical protein [Draconibacterium orientale]|uniref:hypothetical protein n=1 Tax=Draconibacterium orientale TaxID=1168034 RepID=UPI002A0A3F56|nr:hypothetical protein [Draconibacterium orientale]